MVANKINDVILYFMLFITPCALEDLLLHNVYSLTTASVDSMLLDARPLYPVFSC